MGRGRTLLLAGSATSVSTSAAGGGTTNTVAKFTGAYTVGDSLITDDGTTVGFGVGPAITIVPTTQTLRMASGGFIITAAANSPIFVVTGLNLSGSSSSSIIDLTQTWNTSGTPSAIYLNILDTASNAASLLVDLRVGSAGKFQVAKTGAVIHTASVNNRSVENALLYGATTDAATAVELTTNGAAGSGATNRIAVPTNATLSIVLNISVKQSGSASGKQMLRQVVISNNAGTTAIQGSVIALGTDSGTAGLATVATTITANDTDDCLNVVVNGVIGTNLRYTCSIFSSEVIYA